MQSIVVPDHYFYELNSISCSKKNIYIKMTCAKRIKNELQFVDNNFDLKMLMYYLVKCLKQKKKVIL